MLYKKRDILLFYGILDNSSPCIDTIVFRSNLLFYFDYPFVANKCFTG